MGIGYLCTWQAHSLGLVWAMIILVSIGTGLFKGNLSGVNKRRSFCLCFLLGRYKFSLVVLERLLAGFILAGVWAKLANRPQGDMSMYQKTGLGMILLGISYVVMVVADMVAGDGQCIDGIKP